MHYRQGLLHQYRVNCSSYLNHVPSHHFLPINSSYRCLSHGSPCSNHQSLKDIHIHNKNSAQVPHTFTPHLTHHQLPLSLQHPLHPSSHHYNHRLRHHLIYLIPPCNILPHIQRCCPPLNRPHPHQHHTSHHHHHLHNHNPLLHYHRPHPLYLHIHHNNQPNCRHFCILHLKYPYI